uniref:Actin-related protein 2/3 complex subunit 3 n=1 Tax=Aegilops tauschii subsp. strangulata TaxID=200361 RepID=A0A453T150_AEGTS
LSSHPVSLLRSPLRRATPPASSPWHQQRPRRRAFSELLRNYLKQIREETSGRLLNCAYRANGTPNKWWLAFAKRKFMNLVIL